MLQVCVSYLSLVCMLKHCYCLSALKTDPEVDGLTLREVQIGLCCLDPSTVHGGLSAQFRCQFIFYFYNSGKEHLHFKEFKYIYN